MRSPLAVDVCCGLGGWSEGLIAAGFEVIGYDIDARFAGRYPGQLVLQDVRTIDGRPMRGRVSLIVASPPCQRYSYMAMPFKRGKAIAAEYRAHPERIAELNEIFDACFRIAREAECPIVVENVKGAQPWVGAAKAHYGPFFLWGDVGNIGGAIVRSVPRFGEVLRAARRVKGYGGTWFHNAELGTINPNRNRIIPTPAQKNDGGSWFNVAHNTESGVGQNPVNGRKVNTHVAENSPEGTGRTSWFFGNTKHQLRAGNSKCDARRDARREASAQIAKIPFELAKYVGEVFYPGARQ